MLPSLIEKMRQEKNPNIDGPNESEEYAHTPVKEGSVGNTASTDHSQPPTAPEVETSQISMDFEGPNDPMNPLNWTLMYKWTLVVVLSMFTFTA